MNAHASDATIIVRFASTCNSGTQVSTALNVTTPQFALWPGRKMEVEPNLSLARDEFSVRYKC